MSVLIGIPMKHSLISDGILAKNSAFATTFLAFLTFALIRLVPSINRRTSTV